MSLRIVYDEAGTADSMSPEECERFRRMGELQLLDLPAAEFPLIREHARLIAETIVPDTDRWLGQAIDLIVAGLEATVERQTKGAGG